MQNYSKNSNIVKYYFKEFIANEHEHAAHTKPFQNLCTALVSSSTKPPNKVN